MTRTNDDEPPEWAKEQAREMMAAEEPSDDEETEKGDGGETEEGDGERDADADDDRVPDVPADTVDEAERLTRLARRTEDEAAAAFYRERRDELVTDHDYVPRLREEDDTLVLYPDEWMDDGRSSSTGSRPPTGPSRCRCRGPGDAGRYREIAAYNDAVADAVADAHDAVHADTARSFAAFMSNHYVRAVDDATADMRAEFREEYFPRNGWPTDEQLAVVDESLDAIESVAADVDGPEES